MSTLAAYTIVVLVWTTTPLAINWSNDAMSPLAAAGTRMALAALLGGAWLAVRRDVLPLHKQALKSYAATLPGIFGAMACSYVGATYLPSGVLSVMFGLSPLMSGVLMQAWSGGGRLGGWHWIACGLGVLGLAVVFGDSVVAAWRGGHASLSIVGMLWLLLAVLLFSVSGIAVQRVGAGLKPMQQTVGGLTLSLPFYGVAMLLAGESLTVTLVPHGIGAIVYLATCASLLGFACYFYILARLPAATVSLVTLITPVLALCVGHVFNNEPLTNNMVLGALVIVSALALYLHGDAKQRALRVCEDSAG